MSGIASFGSTFAGKRVLVTGHTGFKGAWLCLWLEQLGAKVTGVGLNPLTDPNLFELTGLSHKITDRRLDIRDYAALASAVGEVRPDFVFHLAAQALVRLSYAAPLETMATNVMGTANLLEAIRLHAPKATIVVVTSDKCYENREWVWPYRENDPLGGHDPYSASKACAEIVAASWRQSFGGQRPRIATARAGNVIGGGDWSQDRIVPDCIRALCQGKPIEVRNPAAIRPWQHVLEPLSGYLLLAAKLSESARYAEAWNFGPADEDTRTVRELVDAVVASWGPEARWLSTGPREAPHEANLLTLTSAKAGQFLGWRPTWGFDLAIQQTMQWYRDWSRGEGNRYEACAMAIAEFTQATRAKHP